MATLTYQPPVVYIPSSSMDEPIVDYSFGTGHSGATVIQEADIVILSSGALARAATNQSGSIAGYAIASETAVFAGTTTTWTYGAYNALPWGYAQVDLPPNPGQIPTSKFQGVQLDINLRNNIGWISGGSFQAVLGQQVGIYLDTTTNLFVVDTQQTNKVAYIFDKPAGPGQGVAGDLAARVRIQFLPTVLV